MPKTKIPNRAKLSDKELLEKIKKDYSERPWEFMSYTSKAKNNQTTNIK